MFQVRASIYEQFVEGSLNFINFTCKVEIFQQYRWVMASILYNTCIVFVCTVYYAYASLYSSVGDVTLL